MVSGGPPDELNERHQLAAMLLAAGYRASEVARHVGLHPNRLSIIKSTSPLFRAQIADLQQELRDAVKEDALAILEQAAPGASRFLAELVADATQPTRERRQAAEGILDRHPALRAAKAPEANIHITFSASDLAAMRAALPSDANTIAAQAEVIVTKSPALIPIEKAGFTREDDE